MHGKIEPKLKKRALHRAKIIEGQVKGLIKQIEGEQYCMEPLTLSLSIQKSIESLERLLLENHLRLHVPHQLHDKKEKEKAIAELLKIYTLSRK